LAGQPSILAEMKAREYVNITAANSVAFLAIWNFLLTIAHK
jgi:hypothetical protein